MCPCAFQFAIPSRANDADAVMAASTATMHNDAVSYLCQQQFHQSIRCPTTTDPVTYALSGEWIEEERASTPPPTTILLVLPSGCTRYVGVTFDALCREEGVRL